MWAPMERSNASRFRNLTPDFSHTCHETRAEPVATANGRKRPWLISNAWQTNETEHRMGFGFGEGLRRGHCLLHRRAWVSPREKRTVSGREALGRGQPGRRVGMRLTVGESKE